MDTKQAALEKKLADLLRKATDVGAQIQTTDQAPGTPHDDQIESHAHQIGQWLSELLQHRRTAQVAAKHATQLACPGCGKRCRVKAKRREVLSPDGPVELIEKVAHCTRCRRDFFPSAPSPGS